MIGGRKATDLFRQPGCLGYYDSQVALIQVAWLFLCAKAAEDRAGSCSKKTVRANSNVATDICKKKESIWTSFWIQKIHW